MVKKVVIAAAGRGTRMLDLSKDKPKHLIEVNGKPFLWYVLDNLSRAGYKDITIVGGYIGELIEKFISNYNISNKGEVSIKFVDQFKEINPQEKYGTACPLMCKEVKNSIGSDQFIFVSGDNLYSVEDLEQMKKDDDYCYIGGLTHENPEKYGVLIAEGGFLKEIIEKPKEYVGNLINTGLYKFTPEVFDKLSFIEKSSRGEYELTDVISLLAKDGKVKVLELKDGWMDFGNPGDIIKCSKFLNEDNSGR